jgi:hypothetical protein
MSTRSIENQEDFGLSFLCHWQASLTQRSLTLASPKPP